MSWPTVEVGSVAEIVSGSTPSTATSDYWGGDIPWATPADLAKLDSKLISSTPRTLTDQGLAASSARLLPVGSVLFSSRAPIGHVAINAVPMATNQGFKSFVPDAAVLSADFLYWWLKSNTVFLQGLGVGATFKEVSKSIVERVKIPLPPLPEQRRIASILDAVDSLRVARRKALREVNRLPGEVFDQLFGPEMLNVPIRDLGDLVAEGTSVTYGIVQAGPEAPGGVPYIRTGDIVEGGIRLAGLRLTSPEIASRFPRSTVRAGEIVMSIRATVGTTALVPEELDGANLTQGTARIAPGPNLEAVYLLGFLRSRQAQAWIRAQVKGATFREITLGRLRELPVPVPHRDLQRRYVRDFELIQSAKCAHESQLVKLDELFASLQYRAFRGEL